MNDKRFLRGYAIFVCIFLTSIIIFMFMIIIFDSNYTLDDWQDLSSMLLPCAFLGWVIGAATINYVLQNKMEEIKSRRSDS